MFVSEENRYVLVFYHMVNVFISFSGTLPIDKSLIHVFIFSSNPRSQIFAFLTIINFLQIKHNSDSFPRCSIFVHLPHNPEFFFWLARVLMNSFYKV